MILTKLVGYQKPTCLCVKMEFVVGNVSRSCQLYSLSWSCFCSCGVDTIVYGKWCFILHVQCCEVAWLAQNIRHSSTRVWLHLQWRSGSLVNNNATSYLPIFAISLCWVW